jgi:hypothetical protein
MLAVRKKIKRSQSFYYRIIMVVTLFLSLFTDFYEPLIFLLTGTLLLFFLDKLGKGIVLRELIAFHFCFICLVMPWIGYRWYTISNPLARLWVRYMPVKEDVYFAFALPAVAAFTVALCWPIKKRGVEDEGQHMFNHINRIKAILETQNQIGKHILFIGLIASLITPFLPVSLQFVGNLMAWSSFAGILYIYFTPGLKYRALILSVFVCLILEQAVLQGMFTIVAYMGLTIFSFLFLRRKVAMWKKLSMFIVSAFLLILVQSIKNNFRQLTWYQGYSGSKTALFADLLTKKVDAGVFNLFNPESFFPLYYRANQGYNIGLVMRRTPNIKPFDNGSKLAIDLASSVVPRFLWPDKPTAGGKYNMKYFTGLNIVGYSTDVGPLGEAYGSFGVMGGIIYMFILGVFIRWAYATVFRVSNKIPLVILWIPVLFYQVTYSAENDSLQILNSLTKGAFLIFILYKSAPGLFGIVRQLGKRRQTVVPA